MKTFYFVIAVALLGGLSAASEYQLPVTEPEFLREYLQGLKQLETKDIPPEGDKGYGSPVEVKCSMYVIDVYQVDSSKMDYTVDFYFRQMWNDTRLAYVDKDISEVVLNDATHIWIPDLFFVQDKKSIHHQAIVSNAFVRISQLGEVMYSVRLAVTFSCPMDLRKFPHDVQKCTFNVESYGRTTQKMLVEWIKSYPVTFNSNVTLHNFNLIDVTEGSSKVTVNTNTYSTLDVTFTFLRKSGLYMTKLYLPFILLSIVSWASLWIPSKMIAVRLPLLLVILYLMVSINTDLSSHMPPTAYLKGSDIWVAACECLVFITLLQYLACYAFQKNVERNMIQHEFESIRVNDVLKAETGINLATNGAGNIVASRLNNNILTDRIDRICRIVFPILFVAFNLVYWLMYCTGH